MATIRLVPSTYAVSNESYSSAANTDNMFTNTDSTTYGTFTHTRASTNYTYYGYIRGFNFNDVPSNVEVTSFTVKIKASATGHTTSTSSSYYMGLINNTTQISNTSASGTLSTTVTTFTFANGSLDWNTIVGYGSDFGIRIPLRRASSSTADVVSVYGAQIQVTYADPRTITTTLSGDGTIDPSGTQSMYDGDEYELVIIPANASDTVTATKNGSNITSSLIYHSGGSGSEERVLGQYTLVSGSFSGSGASYFQGLVGKGHTNTTTTSNYYSSGSGTIAVFTYYVGFTDIPNNATITRVYALVNGHAESTSNSNEYMCAQLRSGSTQLSSQLNFKSVGTSNSTQTVQATTIPTVAQLEDMVLYCRLGYYGGALNGATVYVEYTVAGVYYTYSYTVNGNATIAVTIGGGSAQTDKLYLKVNGSWVEVSSVYKKQNGSWVQQTNLASLFDTNTVYIKG